MAKLENGKRVYTDSEKKMYLMRDLFLAWNKNGGAENFELASKYAWAWEEMLEEFKAKKWIKSYKIDFTNQILYGPDSELTCKIKGFDAQCCKKLTSNVQKYISVCLKNVNKVKAEDKDILRNCHGTDERLSYNDRHRQELQQPSEPNYEMIDYEDRCSSDFPQDVEVMSTTGKEYLI